MNALSSVPNTPLGSGHPGRFVSWDWVSLPLLSSSLLLLLLLLLLTLPSVLLLSALLSFRVLVSSGATALLSTNSERRVSQAGAGQHMGLPTSARTAMPSSCTAEARSSVLEQL